MYSAKELAIARLIKPDIEVAQLDVTDLAILQLVRKATGGGSGVYNATIENGIATFGGVVASSPLVSLLLNIPISQTGSGTQSPDNIRDFVGVSGVTITRNNGVDTGDTYPISFGQTVYSAILDVLTGKLSITHRYIVLNGSENWRALNNGKGGYIELTDVNIINNYCQAECSQYVYSTWTNVSTTDDGKFTLYRNSLWPNARLVINFAGGTLEAFKTQLNNSNIQVVYELAEPIEIQLTPTVINTLIGENVIFADVADVTECKYTRK